jgi:hypothetical protein
MRAQGQLISHEEPLFSKYALRDWLADRHESCLGEVNSPPEQHVLGCDVEAWAAELADKYRAAPVTLHADRWSLEDGGEAEIDVTHEQSRFVGAPSGRVTRPGHLVVLHLPFSGNAELLRCRPQQRSMSPPRASISGKEVVLAYRYADDRQPNLRAEGERLMQDIQKHLDWQRPDLSQWNDGLEQLTNKWVTERRDRLVSHKQRLQGLGIPLRRRDDAPSTYAAPGIARRTTPAARHNGAPAHGRSHAAARSTPPQEPALLGELYEHICQVLRSATRGMERAPATYRDHSEEDVRDWLMLSLNMQYEGKAQGEAFNRSGKTDILMRHEDRNVFIAECKWWRGRQSFADALDQLLGYATWRDAKLALVIFVRAKGIIAVVDKANEALAKHQQFVTWQQPPKEAAEGEMRATVHMPVDEQREATVTVFFAHLPEE